MHIIISMYKVCTLLISTFISLSVLLMLALFPSTAFACDTSKPIKRVLNQTCKVACNNSNNGVWAGDVAYADSELDFRNNKYCAQEEYFISESSCKLGDLNARTSNPCPAGCTNHSECGSQGTCVDGRLDANQICAGNVGSGSKWCKTVLCGWKCGGGPEYCYVKTAYDVLVQGNVGMGFNRDLCGQCVPPTTTTTPIICSDLSRENLTYSCRPPTSSGSCPTG
ncbi:MAG: hypothetical protein US86_C0005G0081, partial [Candidatus Daviesbacteria bacterium GW2011_GWA2_38_24]